MKVTILGLSITSSWGNGHATNYRALARGFERRGDQVTFLERDMPWYAQHRDLPDPPWCETRLYDSVTGLRPFEAVVREADLVVVGSFVPCGVDVAGWVLEQARGAVAFYDIDTPVTIGKLRRGDAEYLTPELVERFDLYLSFTAGPALEVLREEFGARRPEAFYCFVDPDAYTPLDVPTAWTLNYLGTYSEGRQPTVEELLIGPARARPSERFAVAGPMYPPNIDWPPNVELTAHLAPSEHPRFYCATKFTLNVTRPEMRALGYSPSVRLFEAGACGAAIISDVWPGLDTVLVPGEEILLAETCEDVLRVLDETSEEERRRLGAAARRRVLAEHTADRRVERLHELIEVPAPTSGVAR
jgi:spore maturation protein CgeB